MTNPDQPDVFEQIPTVDLSRVASDGWDSEIDRGVSPDVLQDLGYEDPSAVGSGVVQLPETTEDGEEAKNQYRGDAFEGDVHPAYHEAPVILGKDAKKIGLEGVRKAKDAFKKTD